jgi:hypothetical protein
LSRQRCEPQTLSGRSRALDTNAYRPGVRGTGGAGLAGNCPGGLARDLLPPIPCTLFSAKAGKAAAAGDKSDGETVLDRGAHRACPLFRPRGPACHSRLRRPPGSGPRVRPRRVGPGLAVGGEEFQASRLRAGPCGGVRVGPGPPHPCVHPKRTSRTGEIGTESPACGSGFRWTHRQRDGIRMPL